MSLFSEIFVWWHGQTMGTRFYTWRKGRLVGEDGQGNRYYEAKDGREIGGYQRRWVIYNGLAEASRVPPEWHGWLHHTVDTPPGEQGYVPREWEKPHMPNLTGTQHAYRPAGSLHKDARRPQATGDYQAWRPE
ncbi:NADH:ubiquinone oxidoreductase subunit NDUFA12 [Parvibaculum sp.]|jgi:NADH:ubiquinone oxidoreductase subunit|uniref:NADH:ubiquinone oxidoreductase subunit NDUFA12 n=1 Tax=Parvibaculum sp. TaxID=2024848 RepID=UPI000C41261B|nr:NADH:ubiquinone oxidoreductase subunit NDUFA12 [Parvibaculum sp.]MAM96162.1 NADH:ubiquinone oxidoreductase subunit NDUFA12 [Parvibaculum sp.]HCX66085.1 NADH:ubiquinone oxidoreductase subunit NDUFA12 [Rhodobiaceae bacterium]|tara:strand:+ start:34280 stop:34678 length:399 start_codon:yes stop_codon:yes gene_type:complete